MLAVDGVSHRFKDAPVLRDCSFTVPAGAVVALLGRNGAGKTTLLRAVAGLLRPDAGTVTVQGQPVGAAVLPRIGYVGQSATLYPMLTVAQTVRLGARLNPRWDPAYIRDMVAALRPSAKVGRLAPGERTWLAVALALGKRPDLLVLDEPLAPLDPIARTDLVGALMAVVAERGTTVVMSSHVVADIQDVCDHVIVLGDGGVRLAAEVEPALSDHQILVGPAHDLAALDDQDVIDLRRDEREFTALIRSAVPVIRGFAWHRPTLEELLLGYLRATPSRPVAEMAAA
jgi:ABC-2 type transport system ATP-binding protein